MISHFDREQLIWHSSLSTNETILLLALNSFVDANGECWPGQELLARRCKFSDRTVRTTCKKLEEKGVITRNHRQSKLGQRTSDKFKVLFSAIPSQPEDFSKTNRNHFPEGQNQPENHAEPTGRSRQNQPEGASRDLSSKNYPEELSLEGQPEKTSGRERECDASLQPAQPATQSEETHSPVQNKVQDPESKGSASLGSEQAETVDPSQEGESSAASPLENLKIQLNKLRDDYVPPAWRYEWRMAKTLPWRDSRTGDIPESFAVFVGKKLMFKGDRESMTALEKGRNYVRNAEPKVAGMQGLIDYWEDYDAKKSKCVVPIRVETSLPDTEEFKPISPERFAEARAALREARYGIKSA